MKHILLTAIFAGALMTGATWAASDDEFELEPRVQNGVIFLSGGVGLDEREAMQSVQNQYTLWLSFDKKGNTGHDSDTEVSIRDTRGDVVLETTTDGPWLMVKLPPGRYEVLAWQDSVWGKRNITVSGKGMVRQVVRLHEKG